jgi:hypothetical protein
MNIRAAQRIKFGRSSWVTIVSALLVFCSVLLRLLSSSYADGVKSTGAVGLDGTETPPAHTFAVT